MFHRHEAGPRRALLGLLVALGSAGLAACDGGGHTVAVTAEDNRFDPAIVHVRAGAPFILTVFNAGREVHEFASPLLAYAEDQRPADRAAQASVPSVIVLEPGRTARLVVSAPPGTYLYWCKRKGHPNMTGMLISE